MIIGAPYASICYVLFGTENGFVNMTSGFTILGAGLSDMTGWSVSGAGLCSLFVVLVIFKCVFSEQVTSITTPSLIL